MKYHFLYYSVSSTLFCISQHWKQVVGRFYPPKVFIVLVAAIYPVTILSSLLHPPFCPSCSSIWTTSIGPLLPSGFQLQLAIRRLSKKQEGRRTVRIFITLSLCKATFLVEFLSEGNCFLLRILLHNTFLWVSKISLCLHFFRPHGK